MAWSTREVAEMAGTTENTVRHYHRLGLLEEPDRASNGYKQYRARHLVTLLRIRRLAGLGVPLAQIGRVSGSPEDAREALRALDADLAADIERQQQARADIAAILRGGAPADAPAGFEAVAARLSDADRAMVHIHSQLFHPETLSDLRRLVEEDCDPVSVEVDRLPADAGEETKQRLVEGLAPVIARSLLDHPWLSAPGPHLRTSEPVAAQTFVTAVRELYNPAQLEVLTRAGALATEWVRARGDGGADSTPVASG